MTKKEAHITATSLFMQKVNDYRKEHDCGRIEALGVVSKENPALHMAFLKKKN